MKRGRLTVRGVCCAQLLRAGAVGQQEALVLRREKLIGGLKNRGAHLEAARRGLAAGAFATVAHEALLEQGRGLRSRGW